MSRRDFIALAGGAGGLALAGPEMIGSALANRHPHPRPTSLKYLDRNMYRKNADVVSIFDSGEEREAKMQVMAIGARRRDILRQFLGHPDIARHARNRPDQPRGLRLPHRLDRPPDIPHPLQTTTSPPPPPCRH